MKQSQVIGQAVNDSDSVTDIENKTTLDNAVRTETATCIIENAGIADALIAQFSALTGIAKPERKTRAPKADSPYKYKSNDLKALGEDITSLDGFAPYTEPVNPELLTITLYSYVNRIFRLKRTITPQGTVFYQLLNNSLKIIETADISTGDWEQQAEYLKAKIAQYSNGYSVLKDSKGYLWIAVLGRKLMIHKMQEFNIAE